MPDDPVATPAAAPGTPPAGDPTPPPAPAAGEPPAGNDDLVLRAELAQARKDAAKYREELRKREDKDKSDLELATGRATAAEQRVAELEAEVKAGRVKDAAIAAARKANFWDPEVGAALVNDAEIVFDDAGNPKNMDALLSAIAKARPRLVNGSNGATPDYGGGSRGTPASGVDMNELIRRAAGR